MENEIWKDINGYEGLYQISNLGRVKSLSKIIKTNRDTRKIPERILKNQADKMGYFMVELYNNSKKTIFKVHRLVAMAFIPNQENKPQVNHIDGNKKNNCVNNLEWCTNRENQIHAWEKGLQKRFIGIDNPKSKKVIQYTIDKKYVKTWDCINDIERELKIKNYNIIMCCKGKRKTSGGYIWRYAEEWRRFI